MTPDESRAYSRGYAAGRRHAWPAHRPPLPPDSPLVAILMTVLTDLADTVDGELAKFDEGDPMPVSIYPKIDTARAAMAAITQHLAAQGEDATP